MTEYITPERIANSIMQRATEDTYLIVEGKTDYRLFGKFIDKEKCTIEIAFGNLNVVDVINELKKRKFQNAIGIIDADFRVLDNEPNIENILVSDFHDMEITLLNSPCFETVLSNYIQQEKLEELYENNFIKLKEHFFQLSKDLGYLKWLNKTYGLGLIFKPENPEGKTIDYNLFISIKDLKYQGDNKLVEAILNFCNGKVKVHPKKEELIEMLENFKKDVDLNHLCNGHDIMNIISISLKKHISNLNSKSIAADQLEKEFSLSYESRYFISTNLYKNIKTVEQTKKITILTF